MTQWKSREKKNDQGGWFHCQPQHVHTSQVEMLTTHTAFKQNTLSGKLGAGQINFKRGLNTRAVRRESADRSRW
jgi:hypothetical protein